MKDNQSVDADSREKQLQEAIDPERLPVHVAIIMDGNRRWAKARGLPSFMGHRRGTETVRTITTIAREMGIKHLSIYAFSRENWSRSQDEVRFLMSLFREYCNSERQLMKDRGIRFRVLGDIDEMNPGLVEIFRDVMDYTADGRDMTFNVCINYGSRHEITSGVRAIARQVKDGTLDPDAIDEDMVASHLYTVGQPDPDLLIRTSGEIRLSNFLLWQSAYTEFYFTDVLWPDFGRVAFLEAIHHYQKRDRRFGGNSK